MGWGRSDRGTEGQGREAEGSAWTHRRPGVGLVWDSGLGGVLCFLGELPFVVGVATQQKVLSVEAGL